MTTKVTVDAHAGWPVKVTSVNLQTDGTWVEQPSPITVPPKTVQEFYVHSHRRLVVEEMPNS